MCYTAKYQQPAHQNRYRQARNSRLNNRHRPQKDEYHCHANKPATRFLDERTRSTQSLGWIYCRHQTPPLALTYRNLPLARRSTADYRTSGGNAFILLQNPPRQVCVLRLRLTSHSAKVIVRFKLANFGLSGGRSLKTNRLRRSAVLIP